MNLENPENSATVPAETSIDHVINQSKETLRAEEQVKVKKGRGRPKKAVKTVATTVSPVQNAAAPTADSAPVTAEVPDISPFIGPVIGAPFDIFAAKTGFPGFRLSDEEKNAIVPQVEAVLKQYMPATVSSPHAPIYMLAGTIAFLAFTKYMAFTAWQRDQQVAEAPTKLEPAPEVERSSVPNTPHGLFPVTTV